MEVQAPFWGLVSARAQDEERRAVHGQPARRDCHHRAAQDPAGKEGVAALTAGTLTRGTARLPAEALARAIESLGGRLDAAAGTDATIVSGEFLAKDFAAGLDLLHQVVREPAFARDEVRRAREEQAAGIVAALEQPSAVAEKCYAAFLYGTHPYGRPVEGRSTTVKGLGAGDVRDLGDSGVAGAP